MRHYKALRARGRIADARRSGRARTGPRRVAQRGLVRCAPLCPPGSCKASWTSWPVRQTAIIRRATAALAPD